MCAKVRFSPDIASECQKRNFLAIHRVYLILKHEFVSGRARKEDCINRLSDMNILNKSRTYSIIKKGNGIFWDIQGDWLNFKGWANIAIALNISFVGRQVEVDYEDILYSLGLHNQLAALSLYAQRQGLPTSNAYIKSRTGCSKSLLSLYKQDEGLLKSSNNYERIQDEECNSFAFILDKYGSRAKNFDGQFYLQIPSSYFTKTILLLNKYISRRINIQIRKAVGATQKLSLSKLYYCADNIRYNIANSFKKLNHKKPFYPLLKIFNGAYSVFIRLFQQDMSNTIQGRHSLELSRLNQITA